MLKKEASEELIRISTGLPISEFWRWVDEWISHEDIMKLLASWNKERIEQEVRYLNDKVSAYTER